ncbi:uncharacterized protein KIAA1755 homolog isoform 2-T2 [Discoglossus pictus]
MPDRNLCHINNTDIPEHGQLIKYSSDLMIPNLEDITHQDLEGDYVDLVDITPREEHTSSSSCHPEMGDPKRTPQVNRDPDSTVTTNKWECGKALSSEEGACTPCLRRRLNRDLDIQETKCRFRQSYVAALKNPVSFGATHMTDILEDPVGRPELSTMFAALESPACSRRKHPGQGASSRLFSGKESKNGDMSDQGQSRIPKSNSAAGSNSSPSLVHRFSFLRGQRNSSSTGDGLSMDSSANQYGGTWRRVSAVCSPRLSRARFSGKGSAPTATSGLEVTSSVQKVPSKTGLWVSIVGSPIRPTIPWETITDPPIQCQDLCAKLLYSGIACLPGSRDKLGRAVIQVTMDSIAWEAPWCSAREVARLLLYLGSVARKEIKDLGLLVLVDARKMPPSPCLHAALQSAQASCPGSIQSILILVEKEAASQLDRIPGLQVEVLTSLKALSRYVEIGQLTWDLGGTFPYCHSEWVQFYQKLDAFLADLRKASDLLQNSIEELGEGGAPQDSQEAEEKMNQYRELMKLVLSDSRLVSLQREGGTTLARLRKEVTRFYCSQDVRCAVESAVHMYNHLEERVHALVTKSNRRLELLESLLKIREIEGQFSQLSSWMDSDGDNQLHEMDSMEWTLETLERYHKRFKDFFLQATVHYNHGLVLLDDANKFNGSLFPEMESFKAARGSFQTRLTGFYMNVERQKEELEKLLTLYRFCDKITQLTVSCGRYLGQLKAAEHRLWLPETRQCLENYLQRVTEELSSDKFQEMKEESYTLSSCKGLTVWNETWLRCQEAKQMLEETLEKYRDGHRIDWHKDSAMGLDASNQNDEAVVTFSSEVSPGDRREQEEFRPRGSMRSAESTVINCCSFGLHAGSVGLFLRASRSSRNRKAAQESGISQGCSTIEESRSSNGTDAEHTELMAQNSNNEALEILHAPSPKLPRANQEQASNTDHVHWPVIGRSNSDDSCTLPRIDPSRAVMPPGRRCVLSRHASFSTGDTGSQYSTECSSVMSPLLAMEPMTPRLPWMRGRIKDPSPDKEWAANANFAKLHRIMEELLSTERDYVCSLGYVLSHYLCEMDRTDLPPALRGQHAAIFGNLEKLYEFHSHVFLQELTSCRRDPCHVGRCFLKHKEQFGLYAFYSKNKPQSDRLLHDHGLVFFKKKQQELGDKMDLSSYLLKPIQRISKYSLLLQDMEWECRGQPTRQGELQAAQEVVRFQLRHGNDLLAMDAIHDCDVNLKEQGRLLRQGEFIISYRKRKCMRRLFLFEDLILFSKTKRTSLGSEIYVYKQSFKTSEIGLTHSSGGSGLCFEIWFRRRKLEDTYILQAPSAEVKEAWTADLQKILWDQAIKNRELRKQERAFSGLGCKPFTDIQPSDAAISSRAIPSLAGGGDENLHSPPVGAVPFPTSTPPLRSMSVGSRSSASSAVSLGGCSSTSSGRGSLSPHHGCPGSETPWRCCRTEPIQEREANVFLTASSGSSEGSISGFSSSDPSHLPLGNLNICYPLDCWRPQQVVEKPPGSNMP